MGFWGVSVACSCGWRASATAGDRTGGVIFNILPFRRRQTLDPMRSIGSMPPVARRVRRFVSHDDVEEVVPRCFSRLRNRALSGRFFADDLALPHCDESLSEPNSRPTPASHRSGNQSRTPVVGTDLRCAFRGPHSAGAIVGDVNGRTG